MDLNSTMIVTLINFSHLKNAGNDIPLQDIVRINEIIKKLILCLDY
jgi:hypothetical protein